MIIDEKRELRRAYEDAIGAFPSGKGRRNCELLPRAACLAVKLGIDEDAFAEDVRAVAPDMGAADVRHTFRTAVPKIGNTLRDAAARGMFWSRRVKRPESPTFPNRVKQLIQLGADVRTPEELITTFGTVRSPIPWGETIRHLKALFPGGEQTVFIFSADEPTKGVPGWNLMRVNDWLRTTCPNPPDAAGELVVPNPFTGTEGETTDGKRSFVAQSCLAAFPHMVLEFDELPLPEQCAFWAGVIRRGTLPLVSLVHSGGKSIHGVLRVGCADLAAWNAARAQIIAAYAADHDKAFRVDTQSLRPRTGTRLAGVVRKGTGNVQRLLFIRNGGEG